MASHTPGAEPGGLSRGHLLEAVTDAIGLIGHGAGVLLAVSGGPDSTSLAHLVTEARPDLRAAIGHVRHGLRPDRGDAEVAAAHAAALGLRYHERAVKVEPEGEGTEAAARDARYAALARIARSEGLEFVLIGHTADDRAETVLLNIARGTGIRGLGGMSAVRSLGEGLQVVRPLLRLRRDDVRAFVEGEGLDAVSDPTNHDPEQRRRRARDELMPALARLSGGPGDPVGVLARLADLASDDAQALDDLAIRHAREAVVRWGPGRAVPMATLTELPPALSSRVVRLLLAEVRGGARGLSADAVAEVLALEPGQGVDVAGGCWVTAGGGWVAAVPSGLPPLADQAVEVPCELKIAPLDITLSADRPWGGGGEHSGQTLIDLGELAIPRLADAVEQAPPHGPLPPRTRPSARSWVVVPAGVDEGMRVRGRRPGDRIRLRRGQRKVQDVLVDVGLPRALRDLVPILVDAGDEPLWIPGVAQRWWDEDFVAGARVWLGSLGPPAVGYAPGLIPDLE